MTELRKKTQGMNLLVNKKQYQTIYDYTCTSLIQKNYSTTTGKRRLKI